MPSAPKLEAPQGQPLFDVQFRAISESLAGNGVLTNSDLEVTDGANALEIDVAAGTAYYVATEYSFAGAAPAATLSAGDANYDRWDTVAFDTADQTITVREGVAEQYPTPPDIAGGELLLAIVYVPAGATDIGASNILNWRAKFSNEAEEVHYDDTPGVYGIDNVEAALDELQEAAQITAYPLDIATDTEANQYPLANSDLANSTITVTAGTALTTSNEQIGLGGSATLSISAGAIGLTELNSPFALPSISDMDAGGNDLEDQGTTIWDTSEGVVPRPQVDDERTTSGPHTANVTTSGEEVVLVDTSGGVVTVTLASADANNGNFVSVVDVAGAASTNPITVDTEGSETIDGNGSQEMANNYGALIVASDGANWFTAGGSAAGGGVNVEDDGASVLDGASGLDFGTDLAVTDNGDGTVTVDSDAAGVNVLATGTFTHTGGSATSETIAGVTTDQTANLYVEVGVDADPSFSANYAWDYTWGEAWDDTNSQKDVTIDAAWDTDPGSGNDVVLDYRIYTLDVSISKSRIQNLVDSPNGHIPTALLEDTESVEISVPVPDGESLKVYRWGAYLIADGTTPSGVEVQLLDGGDSVQASENTANTESTSTPVAQHGNASGSLSIFKLRITNQSGANYATDGIGGFFAYVVE